MQIKVSGKDYAVTEKDMQVIQNKINQYLEKILPNLNQEIKSARVVIEKPQDYNFKLSFDMWLPEKYHVFAESVKEEFILAVTDLRDKVERQIRKYNQEIGKE